MTEAAGAAGLGLVGVGLGTVSLIEGALAQVVLLAVLLLAFTLAWRRLSVGWPGLGAWNWRRVGPSLGTEGGALKIRRTASTELAFAALVLLLTELSRRGLNRVEHE